MNALVQLDNVKRMLASVSRPYFLTVLTEPSVQGEAMLTHHPAATLTTGIDYFRDAEEDDLPELTEEERAAVNLLPDNLVDILISEVNLGMWPEEVVFTHCNVCGIKLRTEDEEKMGMCERCSKE